MGITFEILSFTQNIKNTLSKKKSKIKIINS